MTSRLGPSKLDPHNPVILVSTIGGYAFDVRWYTDVWSAERNHVKLIASAEGISVHTRYINEIPESWLESAKRVHEELAGNPQADVSYVATHANSVVPNGPLVPVRRSEVS